MSKLWLLLLINQSVLKLVSQLPKCEHATVLLCDLRWVRRSRYGPASCPKTRTGS